jgi:glycine oxidase
MEAREPGPILALSLRSRALYPEWAAALRDESGIDIDLRRDGALVLAKDAAAARHLDAAFRFQRDAGLPVERLDAAAARRAEPALAPAIEAGLFLPEEASLDPALLTRALAAAAERAGARVVTGCAVASVATASGRVEGVVAADGTQHAAARVVIAAGAWSDQIAAPGVTPPPAEPVRGQIVCFEAPGIVRAIVEADDVYLVPRSDGRLLAGSTMERVGFDRRVTAGAMAHLSSGAVALLPALARAPFHRAWAGLRPAAPDGLPVIGPASIEGLLYACGHFRNGIVLAPLTARLVVGMLRGESAGAMGFDAAPFSPRRFEAGGPGA